MSFPPRQGSSTHRESMNFIETAQYNAPSVSLPRSWRQYQHPNGDVYFHNHHLRLTTPDNVRNPQILEYITEARDDHLQCLAGDPNLQRLPPDYELVISDVSDTTAVIRMYSRMAGAAYTWSEDTGLRMKMKEEFWSHVAEYPSHHRDLPPNSEADFVQSLSNAKAAISDGAVFPFSERQIDLIIARYRELAGFRAQGRNVTPSLAWLIGAVMPLDAVGREVGGHNLDHIMNGNYY
ncbi:hypothetical protein BDZ97DRAFT_1656403 [Flammula alnicola]|nr:hypothetical protein BDZ97DRAFT_1656403 [Flammula alnicola]